MGAKGLIVLDRDGVLNKMVVDQEHGLIDSPLHPSQVVVPDSVPKALRALQEAGYSFVIATNQPAAAKGKTTKANLDAVHSEVLERLEGAGVKILGSYLCYHRAEDGCSCRKPRTGLLEQAFSEHTQFQPAKSWMVGDGLMDVQAANSFGLKSVFLGPRKADMIALFSEKQVTPAHWFGSLTEFADFLLKPKD